VRPDFATVIPHPDTSYRRTAMSATKTKAAPEIDHSVNAPANGAHATPHINPFDSMLARFNVAADMLKLNNNKKERNKLCLFFSKHISNLVKINNRKLFCNFFFFHCFLSFLNFRSINFLYITTFGLLKFMKFLL
jgi:hypothetical protein